VALTVSEVHRRPDERRLNEEWILVENQAQAPQATRGCRVLHYKRGAKKGVEVAKLDPGFVLSPGEKIRLVAGNPGTKAHGKAPEDGIEAYYLFMKVPLLKGREGMVRVVKGQFVVLEARYGE